MRLILASLFLLVSCTESKQNPKQPTTPQQSSISAEAKKKICASEFAVDDAEILLFRDESKALKLLVLRPDISRFSHAPWTYYDLNGEQLLIVPERPMSAEQRAADPVIQKMEALKKGLTEDDESLSCR